MVLLNSFSGIVTFINTFTYKLKIENMERQEGYYWVAYVKKFIIAHWDSDFKVWSVCDNEITHYDSYFRHINENRIKQPGESPD